jgi:hypothetical protein
VALNLICLSNSIAQLRFDSSSALIYRVFDSLESYLCAEIESKKGIDSPACIFIDGVLDYAEREKLPHKGKYMYGICVAYKSKHRYYVDIAEKSNRYISICGKLYPIYLFLIDDVFEDYSIFDRNNKVGRGGLLTHGELDDQDWIYVDMENKVYYLKRDFKHRHG